MSYPERNAQFATNINRLSPITFPGLDQQREKHLAIYETISGIAGTCDYLYYLAAGADVFPITLTDNLVMFDTAPFMSNEYPAINNLLAQTGQIVFRDLQNSTDRNVTNDYLRLMSMTAKYMEENTKRMRDGFEVENLDTVNANNFPDVLAGLMILGVNTDELRMSVIEDGYQLSFELDGKQKNVYYFRHTFIDNAEQNREEGEKYMQKIHATIQAKGKIGLLRKGDYHRIALYGLVLKPDILIFDMREPEDDYFEELENYTIIPYWDPTQTKEFGHANKHKVNGAFPLFWVGRRAS